MVWLIRAFLMIPDTLHIAFSFLFVLSQGHYYDRHVFLCHESVYICFSESTTSQIRKLCFSLVPILSFSIQTSTNTKTFTELKYLQKLHAFHETHEYTVASMVSKQ